MMRDLLIEKMLSKTSRKIINEFRESSEYYTLSISVAIRQLIKMTPEIKYFLSAVQHKKHKDL